jgi:hypothetical protein
MPRYTAVLDACVLVPIAIADTLLRVAEKGLYRPLWTDRILSEALRLQSRRFIQASTSASVSLACVRPSTTR